MAKIRVEQIKDLGINGTNIKTIQIGTGAENSIVPLTGVSTIETEGSVAGVGYISDLSVSGNLIELTRTALPGITVTAVQPLPVGAVPFVRDIAASGHTITKTMGAIGNGLAIDNNGVLNLNLAVEPAGGAAGQVISGLSYANGKLVPTYSTVKAAAADVTIADTAELFTATTVEGALAELAGDLQAIDPIVTTVVGGTGIKVTDNGTGNDHAYTVAADFTVNTIKYGEDAGDKAGKTYIRIMDGTTLISETDAAAFVKDGFLASVTKDEATNELIFTWNTDAEAGEANQVTKIAIKDLCDVYTVGEGLVASEDGYKFSHQAGATGLTANTVFGSGLATANKITVKVPSVTVDKFGHVSALTETEVSLEIPESVASAVQTVTSDNYVTATKTGTTVKLATKTKAVADATADADGLATAYSVKTYVDGKINDLDADVTSAEGTNVRVQVVEEAGKITAVNVTDNSINATNLADAINALDAEVTDSNTSNDITVKVTQTDGKLTAVEVTDTLATVAHSGKAADVSIADANNLFGDAVETVQDALAEIAKEIDDMDSSLATTAVSQANKLVKLGYTQEDGVITSLTSDETALEARLTAIENNTITGKEAIVVTPDTATGNNEVSLKLANGEKVLSQDANGLKSTLNLTYDSAAKAIKLWGISATEPIATVDATNFIKDGMLADATIITATNEEGLTPGKRYIKFTFKTYQYGVEGEEVLKVEYLDVESLIDSYTSGNDWIEIDQTTNKISHKTQSDLPTTAQGIVEDVAGTGAYAETKTFKVPQLTVDAAGHVTAVTEKEVSITLPDAPNTTTKEVYTPAEQQKTGEGNGTFTVESGACHFRMYMNGQLLDNDAYTVVGTTVTYVPDNYVALETTDRMDLVYFIKETITVFDTAPQA